MKLCARNIPLMSTSTRFRAVVFDIDGTMFDTLPSLAAAANDVLAKAGLNAVSAPLLRTALNEGLRPMFRRAIALQATCVEPEMAADLENIYLAQYMQQWLLTAPVYFQLKDALSALDMVGVKLGICTNRDRASTEILLAHAGITNLFDAIVGMGDAPRPKPAADPLLLALERLGVAAAEALFVGDSHLDATCARLARVRFAAHLGGYASQPSDLLPNILSFSGYDQVIAWVLGRLTPIEEACHS
jgi:phosphoglycolate phosphatase